MKHGAKHVDATSAVPKPFRAERYFTRPGRDCWGFQRILELMLHIVYPTLQMTQLLDHVFATVLRLDPATQDTIARNISKFLEEELPAVHLTEGVRVAIAKSRAETDRGEYASDADVAAVWTRHGV